MRKPILASILAILALILAACLPVISTTVPAPTVPKSTPSPLPASPIATGPAWQVAEVRAAVVNVRAEPGGEVVGQVYAGMDVEIVACVDGWCEIRTDVLSGWIFEGCLSVETEKGCEAR